MASKQTYHHGDLRQALLDAALLVLANKSVKDLSLREVARRAGVSHTAPYRHFEHKEALLAAVAEEGFIAFGDYLIAAREPLKDKPLQALQATGTAYVRYAWEHPTHYRVMFGQGLENCNHYPSLVKVSKDTFEILVSIIQAGQISADIKPGNSHQLALGAWAQVHGLAMLLLDRQLPLQDLAAIDALANEMIQSLISGLASPSVELRLD